MGVARAGHKITRSLRDGTKRTGLLPNGGTEARPRPGAMVTVLVIEHDREEALHAERLVRAEIPDASVLVAPCLADARRLTARCAADLILTHHELPDGNCADVLSLAEEGPFVVPVFAYVRGELSEAEHVRRAHPRLLDCAPCEPEGGHLRRTPTQYLRALVRIKHAASSETSTRTPELLRRVRHTISRVNHDLNNPLSIISGNAQLLGELAGALELDGELTQPIQDIEEASARVSGILRRLVDLKDQLPVDDATVGDIRAELRTLQAEHHERG